MILQSFSFKELSTTQLYQILQLRQRVFIQEQQSIYDDIDGLDETATHFCCYNQNELGGYCRVRVLADEQKVKIERVVVAKSLRKLKLGVHLMEESLLFANTHFPHFTLTLSAQTHLTGFYQAFGFDVCSSPYDDGGIEHVDMQKESFVL